MARKRKKEESHEEKNTKFVAIKNNNNLIVGWCWRSSVHLCCGNVQRSWSRHQQIGREYTPDNLIQPDKFYFVCVFDSCGWSIAFFFSSLIWFISQMCDNEYVYNIGNKNVHWSIFIYGVHGAVCWDSQRWVCGFDAYFLSLFRSCIWLISIV